MVTKSTIISVHTIPILVLLCLSFISFGIGLFVASTGENTNMIIRDNTDIHNEYLNNKLGLRLIRIIVNIKNMLQNTNIQDQ